MVAFESPVDFGLPEEVAPEGGGIPDIRKVTRISKDAGIPCCMTGASALVWFGAGRVRWDSEICVPTEKMNQAVQLLKSDPHNRAYQPWEPELFQYGSLAHTSHDLAFVVSLSDSKFIHLMILTLTFMTWIEVRLVFPIRNLNHLRRVSWTRKEDQIFLI
ncbi:hypothetical protein RU639_005915 [Aspergillus parasiticus]